MKKIFIPGIFILALFCGSAQAQNAQEIDANAKTFMHKADYTNAVIVLNQGLKQYPGDVEMQKDLAQSWYFQGNFDQAIAAIKPAMESSAADDQSFMIAGSIYKQNGDAKGEEKMYREGLKKFPQSGPLYNVLGESQFNAKDYGAIKNWEKGIEIDPSYSRNYFNAARYYYLTKDKVWSILYGEIFVNMEPNSSKTAEMKQIVFDSYKKIFSSSDLEKDSKDKSDFVKAYLSVMSKEAGAATSGITASSLTSLRTKFILDWFSVSNRPAFKLFDMQQQLIREGVFEAYDQWLFGAAENPDAYANWIKTHGKENDSFKAFQKNRVFRVPAGQYYK